MRKSKISVALLILVLLSTLVFFAEKYSRDEVGDKPGLSGIPSGTQSGQGPGTAVADVKLLSIPEKAYEKSIDKIVPTKFKKGLFWKIERPGYRASYLLGTAHTSDPRVMAITSKIKSQFDAAGTLCTEVKLNIVAIFSLGKAMIYTDDTRLESVVGKELYNKVLAIAKRRNMSEQEVSKMRPWALAMTFSVPANEKGVALDLKLYTDAIKAKKKLCGLEKLEEQINVFAKWELKQQVELLRLTVDNYDLIGQQMEALMGLYTQRDLEGMAKLMKESPTTSELLDENGFVFALVVRRNMVMVNRMQPYLKTGNTFFAVGALHLPGEKGILRLLESMGYKITRVY